MPRLTKKYPIFSKSQMFTIMASEEIPQHQDYLFGIMCRYNILGGMVHKYGLTTKKSLNEALQIKNSDQLLKGNFFAFSPSEYEAFIAKIIFLSQLGN